MSTLQPPEDRQNPTKFFDLDKLRIDDVAYPDKDNLDPLPFPRNYTRQIPTVLLHRYENTLANPRFRPKIKPFEILVPEVIQSQREETAEPMSEVPIPNEESDRRKDSGSSVRVLDEDEEEIRILDDEVILDDSQSDRVLSLSRPLIGKSKPRVVEMVRNNLTFQIQQDEQEPTLDKQPSCSRTFRAPLPLRSDHIASETNECPSRALLFPLIPRNVDHTKVRMHEFKFRMNAESQGALERLRSLKRDVQQLFGDLSFSGHRLARKASAIPLIDHNRRIINHKRIQSGEGRFAAIVEDRVNRKKQVRETKVFDRRALEVFVSLDEAYNKKNKISEREKGNNRKRFIDRHVDDDNDPYPVSNWELSEKRRRIGGFGRSDRQPSWIDAALKAFAPECQNVMGDMPLSFIVSKDATPFQRTDFNKTIARFFFLMRLNIANISYETERLFTRERNYAIFYEPVLRVLGLLNSKNPTRNRVRPVDQVDRIASEDVSRIWPLIYGHLQRQFKEMSSLASLVPVARIDKNYKEFTDEKMKHRKKPRY